MQGDSDRRDYRVFHEVIDGLRDDMREDNARLEDRIMTHITGFQTAHLAVHESDQQTNDAAHAHFSAFIRNAELAQAHRDGALGVFRFAVEVISRNWKPLVTILAAITAVLFAATGDVTLEIVTR